MTNVPRSSDQQRAQKAADTGAIRHAEAADTQPILPMTADHSAEKSETESLSPAGLGMDPGSWDIAIGTTAKPSATKVVAIKARNMLKRGIPMPRILTAAAGMQSDESQGRRRNQTPQGQRHGNHLRDSFP